MLTYLIRRILLMIPTLLGITVVVFTIMAASPGGISSQMLADGLDMKPKEKQALQEYYNKRYGLDDPTPVQYLRWLNNISPIGFVFDDNNKISHFSFTKGSDLGESFRYGRPVWEILKEKLPITLLLNIITIPLIYIVAIAIGAKAATDRGGHFDVSSGVILLALWSLPVMLVAVLLIGFFANIQHWHWFPTSGLSSRAAMDMTFLPHWGSMWDIIKVFIGMMAGAIIAVSLSQYYHKIIRTAIFAVIGAMLGCWMAYSHPETLILNWLFLPLLGAFTLALLAWTNFVFFRIGGLGMIGAGLGLTIAMNTLSEPFIRGFLFDRIWHLVLPIIALSYGSFATLAKLTRTSILENLYSDYARTARAKGVAEKAVLWKHVFRNSLLPLITVLAGILPGLLGGSLIVETIFSIDGMGQLAVEAAKGRDRELVLSITFIGAILTLLGNLIADFLYTLADPRVNYE